MRQYEYKQAYVGRAYPMVGKEELDPVADCLDKYGLDGWLLCAVGPPDSCGVVVLYFCREVAGLAKFWLSKGVHHE